MMDTSNFLRDAASHIRFVAPYIKDGIDKTEAAQILILAGTALEKLLKYALGSINPAFVLKSVDFESITCNLHRATVTFPERLAELEKKSTNDVVTLKAATYRSAIFFDGIRKNSNTIHALTDFRDIAIHRTSDELDIAKVSVLLCRDFIQVVEEACSSLGLEPEKIVGPERSRLLILSSDINGRENLNSRMRALLESHAKLWDQRKDRKNLVEGAQRITSKLLAGGSYSDVKCPACGQTALVEIEPDFDYDPIEKTSYVVGVYPTELKCQFCSLRLDDYDEFKYVDIDSLLADDVQV